MQDLTNRVDARSGDPIPESMIREIINNQQGTNQMRARIRVCDTQLNPLNSMGSDPPAKWNPAKDGPWDPSDIGRLVIPSDSATVSHDTTTPIHGSANFDMVDPHYVPGLTTYNPLTGAEGFPFNPIYNVLQISHVTYNIKNDVMFDVSQGYFIAFLPSAKIQPNARIFTFACLDLTSLIAQAPLLSEYVVYKGYPGGYLGAVVDMLQVGAIPISQGGTGLTPTGNDDAGPAIPSNHIPIGTSLFPAALNQEVLFDDVIAAGTNRLEAVNKLLAAINYDPLWVDHNAMFRSQPIGFWGNYIPPVGWDYSPMPETSIVTDAISQDFASQADANIANIARVEGTPTASNIITANIQSGGAAASTSVVVDTVLGLNIGDSIQFDNGTNVESHGAQNIVGLTITLDAALGYAYTTCTWSNKGNYSAIAVNTGTVNGVQNSVIGTDWIHGLSGGPRAIGKYENDSTLANDAMAALRAKILLQRGSMLPEQIQISTLANPFHEDFDLILFNVADESGRVLIPSSAASPFIETSWTLPLRPTTGRMSHTLQRIVTL